MMPGVQCAGSAMWGQLQTQLAQRNADQAEQRARALQSEARSARAEAVRAQEKARDLDASSSSARSEADGARRNLAAMGSLREVNGALGDLRSQLSEVLSQPALGVAAVSGFTNVEGQTTGTLVDTVA